MPRAMSNAVARRCSSDSSSTALSSGRAPLFRAKTAADFSMHTPQNRATKSDFGSSLEHRHVNRSLTPKREEGFVIIYEYRSALLTSGVIRARSRIFIATTSPFHFALKCVESDNAVPTILSPITKS
jgi:hypothetical protein